MNSLAPSKWKVGTSYSPTSNFTLADVKTAGLDCIEFVIPRNESDLSYEGLKKFNSILEEAKVVGLEVWSIHLPFGHEWDVSTVDSSSRKEIVEFHKGWLKWVQEWNVNRVIIHPSFEPIADEERSKRMEACKDSLSLLAETAKRENIQICVEDLPRTCLGNTSDEINEIISAHEDLRVCLDVNHLLSETTPTFIEKVGNKIITVHMSDYDGIDEKHWLPGKGIIEWNAVIQGLVNIGYKGPFMFEVRQGENQPTQLIQCWKDLLEKYEQ